MNVKRLAAIGLVIGSGGVVATIGCGASGSGTGGTTGSTTSGSTTATVSGSTTASGSTTSASTTTGGTTSSGMQACPDPGAPPGATVGVTDCNSSPCSAGSTCDEVCSATYDCGLAKCGAGGAALCPGLKGTGLEHDGYITATGGCRDTCMGMMALKLVVDPTDCITTVNTLSGASPSYKSFCQNGAAGG